MDPIASAQASAGYASMAFGLASRFPAATKFVWDSAKSAQTQFSNLSPRTRENLMSVATTSKDAAVSVYGSLKKVYPAMLEFGSRPMDKWRQPTSIILYPVANFILFFLPVSTAWGDIALPKDKIVYVGNQNLFGIDTLSTLSAIYLKTGVLPRTAIEPMHFKIPVWKQLLEFFGAFNAHRPDIFDYLMYLEYPLLVYPGGRRDFFRKSSDPKYKLIWKSHVINDINLVAAKEQYAVVPVASIGVNDMFKTLYDLHWNPANPTHSLPLVIPVSYQRQYINFCEPLLLREAMDDDYFIGHMLEETMIKTIQRRAADGDKSILMRRTGKTLAVVFASNGIVMRSINFVFGAAQRQVKNLALYTLKQLEVSEVAHSGGSDSDSDSDDDDNKKRIQPNSRNTDGNESDASSKSSSSNKSNNGTKKAESKGIFGLGLFGGPKDAKEE
ncbi:hypothetical protein BC831DRAFT_442624 [Entophlyctis helioformis]|nr:hypothetical protein BC831DRAFT_442624 [Entophlyctis helioformis]